MGFVVDKVTLGQVFSEYFGFPCKFSFRRLLHIHHHVSFGASTIGQLVVDVPSRLNLTPPQEKKTTAFYFVLWSFYMQPKMM
jgi:fatty acid desaturase